LKETESSIPNNLGRVCIPPFTHTFTKDPKITLHDYTEVDKQRVRKGEGISSKV